MQWLHRDTHADLFFKMYNVKEISIDKNEKKTLEELKKDIVQEFKSAINTSLLENCEIQIGKKD